MHVICFFYEPFHHGVLYLHRCLFVACRAYICRLLCCQASSLAVCSPIYYQKMLMQSSTLGYSPIWFLLYFFTIVIIIFYFINVTLFLLFQIQYFILRLTFQQFFQCGKEITHNMFYRKNPLRQKLYLKAHGRAIIIILHSHRLSLYHHMVPSIGTILRRFF